MRHPLIETRTWLRGDIPAAAAVLRAGGLVAFPTETVYGLGANALDAAAVRLIFSAKGRPATNPVIVHVADPADAARLTSNWTPTAARLAAAFWPGPLTIVVPRADVIPDEVTAGGPTVAIRCPAHAVARELIREAGVPVAAPSANRSTEVSPTTAAHVLKSLAGRIHGVIDGGPCSGGIESTVADATGEFVRILRPGLIDAIALERVVGRVEVGPGAGVARSPGLMAKHYSPRTPVRLLPPEEFAFAEGFRLPAAGPPAEYAATLYATLHAADAAGVGVIVIELPPDTPEWAGVRDRLFRAAAALPPPPG